MINIHGKKNSCYDYDLTFESYSIENIGERIRTLRELHGYSQDDLIKKVNLILELSGQKGSLCRQTLSGIEKGCLPKNFTYQVLLAFCNVFKCSKEYLLGETDVKTQIKETVIKNTGLTEKAVDKLSNYYNNNGMISFINSLLESDELEGIADCFDKAETYSFSSRFTDINSFSIGTDLSGDTYFSERIHTIDSLPNHENYYQVQGDWILTKSPIIKDIEIQKAVDSFRMLLNRLVG